MPGVSGVTVVTNARAYYHYTRGCGRIGARHSLRPLIFRRREVDGKSSSNVLRDREAVSVNERDTITLVMPGLDPGIHQSSLKRMDCRVKPGNDGVTKPRHAPNLNSTPA
jgi:hypothetical protein